VLTSARRLELRPPDESAVRRAARDVRRSYVSILTAFALVLLCGGARAECAPGNLLAHRSPRSSRGVAAPEQLTDGVLAPEGASVGSVDATWMKGLRPYVEWDLGEPERITAAAVQADNNDVYRITGSIDGKHYEPIWTADTVPEQGLRERLGRNLEATARFVRFETLSGDQVFAATEVRVYCGVPEPWPPTRIVRDREPVDAQNVRGWTAQSLKTVVALLAFPFLFVLAPRWGARGRRRTHAVFMLLGALAWTQFGNFNGGNPLQTWDSFHYFMGAKYFPEVGYFDLYRCGAAAERELGRAAEVDSAPIRDVEDNSIYPGDWSRTPEGRCRATFTPARWSSFKTDIEGFRALFQERKVSDSFSDHGFNATPVNVAWLRIWTHDTSVSARHLLWIAQLDSLALAGTVAAITWGFGGLAGAVTALVIGVGGLWSYHWVGGAVGRHTWLFWCALGIASLAKKRPFAGGVALALAGLLRLFPFVFVGAVGLWAIVNAIKARRLDAAGRRFLAATALTCAVGITVAGAAVGFGSYRSFAHVFERHSHSPVVNHLGLSTLLSWTAGESSGSLIQPQLTNPFERWERHQLIRRTEQRPLWAFAVTVSLAVIVLSAWRGASAAECAALSGLLLYSALPMTSYDYTWLIVLVALAGRRPRILPALLAFAVFTHLLFVFGGDETEMQHLLASATCAVLLAYSVEWRALWGDLLQKLAPPSETK
jgi:hypothetical protein